MTNIKLTDTANVIVTKAYLNANIVPSQEKCGISSSRSYLAALRSFMKNDWVKMTGGLKGMAQEGDYATPDGQRLFFTQAFLDAFYGTEDSIPAIVPNDEPVPAKKTPKKAPKKATKPAKVEDDIVEDDTATMDVVEMLEDDEEEKPASAIASKYKAKYAEKRAEGGTGQGCNDAIDRWMSATFMSKTVVTRTVTTKKGTQRTVNRKVLRLDRDALIAFANENNIFAPKYLTLNNGMLRMDLANKVRRMLATSPVRYNGKIVLRPVAKEKKAA